MAVAIDSNAGVELKQQEQDVFQGAEPGAG